MRAQPVLPKQRGKTCLYMCGLLLALMAGCNSQNGNYATGGTHGTVPHQLKRSELTEAERKYGIAPVPDSSVTYQPDVVLVGGGPEAIRSMDPNGFVWSIDAGAPRAAELEPGKVFFMTSRAVGRVLDVRRDGNNLVIVVGPVSLTDIASEAHLQIEDMPIDFNEAIAYTAENLPGAQALTEPRSQPPPATRFVPSQDRLLNAVYVPDGGWRSQMVDDTVSGMPMLPNVQNVPNLPDVPTVPDVSSALLEKNFSLLPSVSSEGIGLHVSANGGGLIVDAATSVGLEKPTLNVTLVIKRAQIKEAAIELKGAASLSWKFAAGSDVGRSANVNALLSPKTDLSIPVGGLGPIPIAVTVRQRFLIKTALGVRNSTISANGTYTFTGGFKVGYTSGGWAPPQGPVNTTTVTSMTRETGGLSMGAEGVDLANQIKVIAGIGAFGFTAGPFVSFTTAVGVFRGSDIGMIACNGATLDISLSGGIGYFIPAAVTRAINIILKVFHINKVISNEGGTESGKREVVKATSVLGGCKFDTGEKIGLKGPV